MRLFLALVSTAAIPLSLMAAPAFPPAPIKGSDAYELVQKKGKMKGKQGLPPCSFRCKHKCAQKPPACMAKCLRVCR
jgi:hypothetical protein